MQLYHSGSVVCVVFYSFLRLSSTWLPHLLRQLHNKCPLLVMHRSSSLFRLHEVAGRAKLLRFDLAMDLCLLRQSRLHPNLFSRSSPDKMEIADELGQDEQFQGITKKAVRDRLLKLLEQHKAKDNWRKKQ